jgi:hypothetical protein
MRTARRGAMHMARDHRQGLSQHLSGFEPSPCTIKRPVQQFYLVKSLPYYICTFYLAREPNVGEFLSAQVSFPWTLETRLSSPPYRACWSARDTLPSKCTLLSFDKK